MQNFIANIDILILILINLKKTKICILIRINYETNHNEIFRKYNIIFILEIFIFLNVII
jgi:hypothetical protein